MKLLKRVNSIFDGTVNLFAAITGVLIVFMTLAVTADVVLRYFFHNPIEWASEVSEYILLFTTFLGSAWVLKMDKHIKMDLLFNRLNPTNQRVANVVISVMTTTICLMLVWFSARVTLDFYRMGYTAYGELRTPKYILLSFITVGTLLLSIQSVKSTFGYIGNRQLPRDSKQES